MGEELSYWRGHPARLGERECAIAMLNQFPADRPSFHPLRAAAAIQDPMDAFERRH